MKKILIKLAFWILKKYPLEKEPFLYFNGKEYQATGTSYKPLLDGKELLVIYAERK